MISDEVRIQSTLTEIQKRNGTVVEFDSQKIADAISKCFDANGFVLFHDLEYVVDVVVANVERDIRQTKKILTVEIVQENVENTLIELGYIPAAKKYIQYRHDRAKVREANYIPSTVVETYERDKQYFPTLLQQVQFTDKYSRWNYNLGRRETWTETVKRAVDFLQELVVTRTGIDLGQNTYSRIERAILEMRVMPSMRLLAMAGPAARRDNATIYNCAYLPVDSIESFCEAMVLSMDGCGVGFSVEAVNVRKLPVIAEKTDATRAIFDWVVEDSTEGWVTAFRFGLTEWFRGNDVNFDFSRVRPAGTVLKIKGGRASGPEPLKRLFDFTRERILGKGGKQLTTIDAHDIMCAVGNAVVSGGVRRTAMISLFDSDDMNMLQSKSGDFEIENSQRWNANNSAVWLDNNMTQRQFMDQFVEMIQSGRGEPGIFSRRAAQKLAPPRRKTESIQFGCNPCGEINLRPRQLCNLSAVIARHDDTLESLTDKVEVAAIIGTIQSLATYFPNLSQTWSDNCEEERLLGVDITGQQDARDILTTANMQHLQFIAVETNRLYADMLGINQSAAVTCVKPSGNTSQLVDCSSGLHARWAPYYIRNIRIGSHSALSRVLKEAGVSMSAENGDDPINPRTWVVSFPVKAPEGSKTKGTYSAIEQCEWWLRNKIFWTEHNPSVTITYKPTEVVDLMKWVWDHKELVGGMAFLPEFTDKYDQLPYIEISEQEYLERKAYMDSLDVRLERMFLYEKEDHTTAAQELACVAGVCEL